MITTEEIGQLVRTVRTLGNVTQKQLAHASGTGPRFIMDLENGKTTCQIGKVLQVLSVFGLRLTTDFVPELPKKRRRRKR